MGLATQKDLTYRSDYGSVARILNKYGQLETLQNNGFDAISMEAQNEINKLKVWCGWGDEVYRNALNQQYNLSISGGGELANYYFSAGYYNEEEPLGELGSNVII
ncbi:MAG: hypothetical protein ACLU4J_10215 [Butyricimonas paravirosa]